MHAPYTNDRRVTGQGLVRGCFEVSKTSAFFEWADRADAHQGYEDARLCRDRRGARRITRGGNVAHKSAARI